MVSNNFDLENISTPYEGASPLTYNLPTLSSDTPRLVLPCLGNPLSPHMQILGEKFTLLAIAYYFLCTQK